MAHGWLNPSRHLPYRKTLNPEYNIMKRSYFVAALIVGLALARSAFALPMLQGSVKFGGTATLDSAIPTATQVSTWGTQTVGFVYGNFNSFASPGDIAVMSRPWVFGDPLPALWTINSGYFDLGSNWVTQRQPSFIDVRGVGTIYAPGYDPTPAFWHFTGTGGDANLQIGTETFAPDGGMTAVLLGIGLTGLALLGRIRRKLV